MEKKPMKVAVLGASAVSKLKMPASAAALLAETAIPQAEQGPGVLDGKSALQDMASEHVSANQSENLAFDAQMLQVQSMINLGIGSAMAAAGIVELEISTASLLDFSARYEVVMTPHQEGGYNVKLVAHDDETVSALKAAFGGGVDE